MLVVNQNLAQTSALFQDGFVVVARKIYVIVVLVQMVVLILLFIVVVLLRKIAEMVIVYKCPENFNY